MPYLSEKSGTARRSIPTGKPASGVAATILRTFLAGRPRSLTRDAAAGVPGMPPRHFTKRYKGIGLKPALRDARGTTANVREPAFLHGQRAGTKQVRRSHQVPPLLTGRRFHPPPERNLEWKAPRPKTHPIERLHELITQYHGKKPSFCPAIQITVITDNYRSSLAGKPPLVPCNNEKNKDTPST